VRERYAGAVATTCQLAVDLLEVATNVKALYFRRVGA